MKNHRLISTVFGLVLCVLLTLPHFSYAYTSGRGLFKDMYCAVLSLVNKECEEEIEGVKVKIRAEEKPTLYARAQAAVSGAFSKVFSN